ncbi:16S rRNA (adenine(1518)-N(6)/adenine(1519)-N(6))-dimethyltransferase RsmA, partial [Liberiplasma polymorphum]|uniref:16S rRNA (adenine(1518)-N(6)/adenine(1519)-N(6))- dimethyltransferase RsmA n=1 Tax=Liberiplasma polymorphum TaxID=3374570 RepID=UPI003774BA62
MRSSNPKSIHEILKSNAITIKKRYGQNFLIDDNILQNIVALGRITNETLVIEIGPGLGSLTQYLVNKAKHVIAYEIDNDLIPILKSTFTSEHFTLIHDDILKRNIDNDIATIKQSFDQIVVIANLPYYITTPILMKCLEESKRINRMVVMMQLEVARRLTANKNTKDYNALSVAVQYRAYTNFAFKVPKNVFIPAPNVESAVITLDFGAQKDHNVKNETFFFECVKAAFKQRRKTLLNNLSLFLE